MCSCFFSSANTHSTMDDTLEARPSLKSIALNVHQHFSLFKKYIFRGLDCTSLCPVKWPIIFICVAAGARRGVGVERAGSLAAARVFLIPAEKQTFPCQIKWD